MKISNVSIKNFRAIKKQPNIDFKKLTMLIGDNGCSKTTILEAIHYCLSPSFLEDRIKPTDFYIGTDEPIEIVVEFDDNFGAILYDGYDPKEEICRKVFLQIKKRDKASAKAFSDGFVVTHYVVPERDKNDEKGWVLERMGGKSDFKFSERALSFSSGVETKGLPRSFYYNKERDKQVYRGFKTSINRIFEDFNWRFARGLRKENADLEEGQEKFVHRKVAIEKEIKGKVDDKMESTIREMNKKLTSLGLHEVDVSIFDGATPFDSAFLHQKVEELELPISNLGSGVEMIVSLMLLETLSALTKVDFLVIIDEPEI